MRRPDVALRVIAKRQPSTWNRLTSVALADFSDACGSSSAGRRAAEVHDSEGWGGRTTSLLAPGSNVLASGKDIEADAVYFTHELQAIIGRWVALDYRRRPHDGLRVPEMPHLTLSPNKAYGEAVARAGFLYVPGDPDLHRHTRRGSLDPSHHP